MWWRMCGGEAGKCGWVGFLGEEQGTERRTGDGEEDKGTKAGGVARLKQLCLQAVSSIDLKLHQQRSICACGCKNATRLNRPLA